MKAAVYNRGDIQIQDAEKPVPKANEVLVRIHATTICAADYRLKNFPRVFAMLIGLWKGKILGMEFRGTGFKLGTHAEYACALESRLEMKPANMALEEATASCLAGSLRYAFCGKQRSSPDSTYWYSSIRSTCRLFRGNAIARQ
jgi:NADPH:quinone reductase-like Zn-dependent oxidoreductase